MARVTLSQVCDAVAQTLGDQSDCLVRVESFDQLSETFTDFPMAQIMAVRTTTDPSGGNDRLSFRAVQRVTTVEIRVDVAVAPRSALAENMQRTTEVWEDIQTILEAQTIAPLYGLTGIRAHDWTIALATLERPDQTVLGLTVTINATIF